MEKTDENDLYLNLKIMPSGSACEVFTSRLPKAVQLWWLDCKSI